MLKVKGRVERKEGLPRIVAMELEELHLEPGLDPLYLFANEFVGLSREDAERALGSDPGLTPAEVRYYSYPAMGGKSGSAASKTPPTFTPTSSKYSARAVSATGASVPYRIWSRFLKQEADLADRRLFSTLPNPPS